MYTGDHWLIDCIGGAAYAYVSYYLITHASVVQRRLASLRDDTLSVGGMVGARERVMALPSTVSWVRLLLGAGIALVGVGGVQEMERAGHTATWLYLVPWGAVIVGAWLVAASVIRRGGRAP
jgi:hypothetical protein